MTCHWLPINNRTLMREGMTIEVAHTGIDDPRWRVGVGTVVRRASGLLDVAARWCAPQVDPPPGVERPGHWWRPTDRPGSDGS